MSFKIVLLVEPDAGATRFALGVLVPVLLGVSDSVVASIRTWYVATRSPAMKFGDLATIGWSDNVSPVNS